MLSMKEKLAFTYPNASISDDLREAVEEDVADLMSDDDMGDCRCRSIRIAVMIAFPLAHYYDASVDCDCGKKRAPIKNRPYPPHDR
jgi:hypothetical protein